MATATLMKSSFIGWTSAIPAPPDSQFSAHFLSGSRLRKSSKQPPRLPLVTELFDYTKIDEQASGQSCSLAQALQKQDLFINSTLSHLGCGLLWKLLQEGMIEYHGVFLNLDTLKTNPLKIKS
jgi:hypothetical protein